MRAVVCISLLNLLSWSQALPHSGPRCDIAQENMSDCGYYGIQELECIERGCCWRPCHGCGNVPWCYKSREMFREECLLEPEEKTDCGYYGIQREECLQRGCCWMPSTVPSDPWCYSQTDIAYTTHIPPTEQPLPVTTTSPVENGNNGDIRLADVDPQGRGRLEVFYNGEWGRVCDDRFTNKAAIVACRQLGYPVSDSDVLDYFLLLPETRGTIMLDEVVCQGNEDRLVDCEHNPFTSNDCGNYEDVFLSCEPIEAKIRLSEGDSGRLEIFYRGEWGALNTYGAGDNGASTVCKSLGYESGGQIGNDDNVQLPNVLAYLDCTGSEDNIFHCPHSAFYSTTTDSNLYVACEGGKPSNEVDHTAIYNYLDSMLGEENLEDLIRDEMKEIMAGKESNEENSSGSGENSGNDDNEYSGYGESSGSEASASGAYSGYGRPDAEGHTTGYEDPDSNGDNDGFEFFGYDDEDDNYIGTSHENESGNSSSVENMLPVFPNENANENAKPPSHLDDNKVE